MNKPKLCTCSDAPFSPFGQVKTKAVIESVKFVKKATIPKGAWELDMTLLVATGII